jgi:hypothetical protein
MKMCKISKDDVIAQLEWFLENNDWVESLDCDNHTKESLRWVIDYLNKDNERKQGADDALVFGDALVSDDARVSGELKVDCVLCSKFSFKKQKQLDKWLKLEKQFEKEEVVK